MSKMIPFLKDDTWPEWARFRHPLLWLVAILLVAAVLRVYGISHISPPGLEHDEVANWLIDRAILDGRMAIYFQEAYGHEAGFHYLQAAFVGLLGDHALALRLPAAYVGILVVAVHYALTKRLFGVTTAMISTALLAVLFWPVFYSRLGLRAISLPLICGFALYAWWKAWPGTGKRNSNPMFWFGLSGLLAGLSLYTYMAARAAPIFFALFTLYLVLFHTVDFRRYWRGIVLFWLLFVLAALPLVLYLWANPGAEFRISEIDAPLRALLAGDLRPVLQNAVKIGGMFGLAGDLLWRQNVAGRPVFDPLLGLFFYGGLLLALLRLKDARYAFLLIWLGVSVVPSLVTSDAPSSIRMINGLLVFTVVPVLVINILARLSPLSPRLSTVLAYLLGLLFLFTHIWWSSNDIFHRWPQNEEVQFVWQAALTDSAAYLDRSPDNDPVAIGGWSPATMDPPTMLLSMRRRDLEMRFFGSDSTSAPISTVIVPDTADGARLLRPAIRELSPKIESQLRQWGAEPQNMGTFELYELPALAASETGMDAKVIFEEQIQLLKTELPEDLSACDQEACSILSVWRVQAAAANPRRFFLHALDRDGAIVAQHDGLDAPAQYWQMGDLLIQEHSLPLVDGEIVQLRLGLYDPQNGRRLLLPDGSDSYLLLQP